MRKFSTTFVAAIVLTAGVLSARADMTTEQIKAHLQSGDALSKAGKWDEAEKEYSTVINLIENSPLKINALIARGVVYQRQGELKTAMTDWTRAIEIARVILDGPQDLEMQIATAYRYRGLAWSEQEEWKKAIADFNQSLEHNPKDVETLIARGEAHSHFGADNDVDEKPTVQPMDDFNAALSINPKSARAYVARGIYKQRVFGITQEARTGSPDFEKAIKVDPQYAEGWFRRSEARRYLNPDTAAMLAIKSDYDRAIALEPKAEYYEARADLLIWLPKVDYVARVADYTAAIKLNPNKYQLYLKRAQAQAGTPRPNNGQRLSDYSQAIKLLRKELHSLVSAGAFDGAATALAELKLELANALTARGALQLEGGQSKLARADFKEATQLAPIEMQPWSSLAHAQLKNGDYANAEATLTSALKQKFPASLAEHRDMLRLHLIFVRAVQNRAPKKADLGLLLTAPDIQLRYWLGIAEEILARHPKNAALKNLCDAIVAENIKRQKALSH